MSANLFISNTSKSAAALAIEDLGKRLASCGNFIVIVPERHSLDTEKQIYETLQLEGSDNIDVVSFSRLAYKITKGTSLKTLTREGSAILLNKIINDNKDALVHYRIAAGKPRFAADMLIALDSLKVSGITPEQLRAAASGLAQSNRGKLIDIAYIYQAYIEKLEGQYSDVHTRLEALVKAIPASNIIAASDIYIIGHNFFDSQQKAIIASLIKHAKSFNIALCEPDHNQSIKDLNETRNIIISYAEHAGKNSNIIKGGQALLPPIGMLCSKLYSYEGVPPCSDQDSLTVFYELNPYEEVKAVGKEIVRLVREGKYRYKDIALLSPNDSYKTIIRDIFTRYDIPIYIDIKYPAIFDIFTVFLTNALEAAHSPRQRNMFALAKHPFLQEQGDAFEDYCIKYNIDFSYFNNEFIFGDQDKVIAEGTRKAILAILEPLKRAKPTYKDIGEAVLQFINRFIPKHNEFLKSKGLDAGSKGASEQVPEKIKNIISESVNILGEMQSTLEEFSLMLAASLEKNQISVIPQYIDAVFAGGLQEASYNQAKVLFFVGANQSAYPAIPAVQNILNLYDMDTLASAGLSLYPAPSKAMERERFIILDTLAKAEDKVYISCSAYDLAGSVLKKGDLYKEALQLCGNYEYSIYNSFKEKSFASPADFYNFAINTRNLFYEYAQQLRQSTFGLPIQSIESYLLSKGWANMLERIRKKEEDIIEPHNCFFNKQGNCFTTSVSQLENYFTCPYMHYFAYGLRLKEREQAHLAAKDIGILLHNALELYFENNKARIHSMSDKEIKAEREKVVEQVFGDPIIQSQMNTPLGARLYSIVKDECSKAIFTLSKNLQKGAYTPKFIELQFGTLEGFSGVELNVEGDIFLIRGKIDRVDMCNNNVIIIDYKSSDSVAGNCEYANIYNGTKIQLLIYLQAFLKGGYIPRGVFYLPLGTSYAKGGNLRFLLHGFIDESEDAFAKLDNDAYSQAIQGKVQSEVANFKINRQKNEFKITTNTKRVLSQEDFASLTKYVIAISAKALGEIKQGYIARRPYSRACKWCNYSSICNGEVEYRGEYQVGKGDILN